MNRVSRLLWLLSLLFPLAALADRLDLDTTGSVENIVSGTYDNTGACTWDPAWLCDQYSGLVTGTGVLNFGGTATVDGTLLLRESVMNVFGGSIDALDCWGDFDRILNISGGSIGWIWTTNCGVISIFGGDVDNIGGYGSTPAISVFGYGFDTTIEYIEGASECCNIRYILLTGFYGDGTAFDITFWSDDGLPESWERTILVDIGPPTMSIDIDVQPDNDANCFNINGHGIIPVTIFGSDTFDVSNIDQGSLSFGGLEVRVRGNKGPHCNLEDTNIDGLVDLLCRFEDDPDMWDVGGDEATLTGALFDGTEFQGSDSICIVP